MTLIVLTVVVIGLLIAALAIYLFVLGVLLNRIAGTLEDCWENVRIITGHAQAIGPGVTRLNKVGGDLLGAMPLLIEGADGVAAKLIPSATARAAPSTAAPAASTVGTPEAVRVGGGYQDSAVGVGYLDA
ncbi:MAG: hypothetical protein ACRDRG_05825 [Pseudonocardiaceae bacterium]